MAQSCDVIIVGSGVAGLCAAIEVAASGLEVVVIDRFAGGGASALSGGVVYAGGGTVIQKQAGEVDSVENMFNYLKQEVNGVVTDKTLLNFCKQSSDNLDWLIKQGVPFDATTYDEKTSYPPDGYFLYYSGNEICAPYKEHASPARRGHRTKGKSFTGKVLYQQLCQRAARFDNIRQVNFADVVGFEQNDDGTIIGIQYQKIGRGKGDLSSRMLSAFANKMTIVKPSVGSKLREKIKLKQVKQPVQTLRANNGVILASGGFVFNKKMVKEHAPLYRHCQPLGENCDGAAIELATEVGASTGSMGNFSAWRFISPPTAMCKGLLVGSDGQRIINEDLYGAKTAEHMVEKNQGKGLLIVDSHLLKEIKSQARPGKMAWHQWMPNRIMLAGCSKDAETITQLAHKCQLPELALAETLQQYNVDTNRRIDSYGKSEKYLQALDHPPFYAIDISIDNPIVPTPALSLGGLVVNEENSMVVNEQGEGIKGLYAIGRAAVGICSNSYVSGLSLADCVYSGRRAAKGIIETLAKA